MPPQVKHKIPAIIPPILLPDGFVIGERAITKSKTLNSNNVVLTIMLGLFLSGDAILFLSIMCPIENHVVTTPTKKSTSLMSKPNIGDGESHIGTKYAIPLNNRAGALMPMQSKAAIGTKGVSMPLGGTALWAK